MRGWVIQQLMCNFVIRYSDFNARFGRDFHTYFSEELGTLQSFVDDNFLSIDERGIEVSSIGRVFIRNIAMVFDAYLKPTRQRTQFSRTI